MPKILVLASCVFSVGAHAADLAGRWDGTVAIPGFPLHVTADLDRDAAGGWIGSIVVPELNLKGQPLTAITQHDAAVGFAIAGALAEPDAEPAKFDAALEADGTLKGTFLQAGNRAPFLLKRSGPAQVDLPPHSTAVAKNLEGQWVGDYELGYPRHVTLTFTNHDAAPASVEFIIVGKKNNNLPVDLVTQNGDFVRVESHQFGINFEGRVRGDGELAGTCEQGPIELPLTLHRATGSTP